MGAGLYLGVGVGSYELCMLREPEQSLLKHTIAWENLKPPSKSV